MAARRSRAAAPVTCEYHPGLPERCSLLSGYFLPTCGPCPSFRISEVNPLLTTFALHRRDERLFKAVAPEGESTGLIKSFFPLLIDISWPLCCPRNSREHNLRAGDLLPDPCISLQLFAIIMDNLIDTQCISFVVDDSPTFRRAQN
jgi:hypothetical protein